MTGFGQSGEVDDILYAKNSRQLASRQRERALTVAIAAGVAANASSQAQN